MRSLLAVFLLGCATAIYSPAQTFTVLYSFNFDDGDWPGGVLVQGADGNFYGTTGNGGPGKFGVVYKITSTGTYTMLAGFGSHNGSSPSAGLALGLDGNFYGTTTEGGPNNDGTVFRISPEGALTTLYAFNGTNGGIPNTALVQAFDRNFYGTTQGNENNVPGSFFKMTPGGDVTTLSVVSGDPPTGLIQARDGNFYGTTDALFDGGGIFKMTADGAVTIIYTFCAQPGCADGWIPVALIQGSNGNFYGETDDGAANDSGTVFEFDPATATITTIHNFNFNNGRGVYHPSSLMQATDGNLYGTTSAGGAYGPGTIFTINAAGAFSVIHSFQAQEGSEPTGLLQATDGDFYGTTFMGGANDSGAVFHLSMGLAAFVKTLPMIGHMGATVEILGTDLTGATSVTFNGTPAAFTIVSATKITATVPAGATTGKVQVTTPGGTLLSNVAYRVVP